MRRALQILGGRLNGFEVVPGKSALGALDRPFHGFDIALREFLAILPNELLHLVNTRIEGVASLDFRQLAPVLVRVGFRFPAHFFGLFLIQAGRGGNGDLLLFIGCQVFRRDVQDAVGIDIKRHLDLRHASRRRRNAHQVEFSEGAVVGRHFALSLQDVNLHGGLIIRSG